jgi:hypothetical protein
LPGTHEYDEFTRCRKTRNAATPSTTTMRELTVMAGARRLPLEAADPPEGGLVLAVGALAFFLALAAATRAAPAVAAASALEVFVRVSYASYLPPDLFATSRAFA